ncbi:MAG: hypothetical protein LC789_11690 [Actinobacteria bacterium]|nr:hypothetical protein [Actinomycetota bacterium]
MTAGPAERPPLMIRLAAKLKGEVSAATAEAYRQAGKQVYDDLLRADAARERLAANGGTLWDAPAGTRTQLLASWNAFVLQALGEALLDEDYAADPSTVGFLPPVTAEQTARVLGEVEQWTAAARRGEADPEYDVARDIALPAPLPPWVEVEPCPPSHLSAMMAAARAMRERADHALADFGRLGDTGNHAADAAALAGVAADLGSAVDYAQGLAAAREPSVHERAERSIKRAVEGYYRLGQLLAAPALLHAPGATPAGPASRLRLPGEAGFDPWVLTDPATRAAWQRDPLAVQAVETMWRYDPDPEATLALQAEIDQAVESGRVRRGAAADGRRLGNYYCCPWSPIYTVLKPVTVDGRRLRGGQQFALEVSAEEVLEGGPFTREVVLGPFSPTTRIDYCDPAAGGHDDD